jgi:hypothetical protein
MLPCERIENIPGLLVLLMDNLEDDVVKDEIVKIFG